MNPLQSRLAALRRRLRFVVLVRGLGSLTALLLMGALFSMALDWAFNLPSPVRALLLVGLLAASGTIAYRFLIAPLRNKMDDLTLALQVEDRYPILNDSLASTVEFLRQPDDESGSATLKREAVQRALRLAQGCDFNVLVNGRGVRWALGGATAALLAAGYVFCFSSFTLASTALARFVDPFGDHTWTTLTSVKLDHPNKKDKSDVPGQIPRGKVVTLSGKVGGLQPDKIKIEIQGQQALSVRVKDGAFAQDLPSAVTDRVGTVRFRVLAYDGSYPSRPGRWQEVQVRPPPQFQRYSPQIDYEYPGYTELPPQKNAAGIGDIDVWAGAVVTFRAAVDRPVEQAWIEIRPKLGQLEDAERAQLYFKQALPLNLFGSVGPLDGVTRHVLARALGGRTVFESIPVSISPDGKELTAVFQPWVSGNYAVRIDDGQLDKEYFYELTVKPDPRPTVRLLLVNDKSTGGRKQPKKDEAGRARPMKQFLLPDASINLLLKAEDPTFALRSVFLEYKRKSEGRHLPPARLPIYDHGVFGRLFSRTFAALSGPIKAPVPPLRLRLQEIDQVHYRWALAGRFAEGDVLTVEGCADDFNNVVPFQSLGRSTDKDKSNYLEIHIVSKAQLARLLNNRMAEVQEKLVEAQEKQNRAIREFAKLKDEIARLERDKLDPHKQEARLNQLMIEAEQRQKDVQKAILDPEHGAQAKLDEIQQMFRDNNMPPSNLQDRAEMLNHALEKMVEEKLDEIERNLADAKKEIAEKLREEKVDPKVDPKKDNLLDKAQSLQQDAKRAIDELVRALNPWASTNQIGNQAQGLLDKQRDYKKETQQLVEKGNRAANEDVDNLVKKQENLAQEMRAFLEKMKEVAEKQEEEGNKDAADRIRKAIEAAEQGVDKTSIDKAMERAAKDLNHKDETVGRNPQHHQAMQEQQKAIEGLKKLTDALEERRDDIVQKMLDEQMKADAKLAELIRQQEKLQEEARELEERLAKKKKALEKAREAKDPEAIKKAEADLAQQRLENQKAMERMAQEQRALQERIRQQARELAKINAAEAARELDNAAREMERVIQMLEKREEPPQDAFDDPLEKLDNAQEKLQQAEEELLREQLARVADKIKGVKERQDAALKEMIRLHAESIVKRQSWTRVLLSSLEELAETQKGLGRETESLKESLKGAKVFERILSKAAESMDEAAKAMAERQDAGKLRLGPLEDSELAGEKRAQDEILKHQHDAARRLQRLLDALKNAQIAKKPPLRQEADPKQEKKNPKDPKDPKEAANNVGGAGDGIPDNAQLKALRDEQKELNDRTKAFVERQIAIFVGGGGAVTPVPLDPEKLPMNAAQRRELNQIQAEQAALRDLFNQITTRAQAQKEEKQ